MHTVSDGIIGLSYLLIALSLGVLIYRSRETIPFKRIVSAFVVLMVAAGLSRLIAVWTPWDLSYRADALVNGLTAVVSLGTALALPALIPAVLRTLHDAREGRRRQAKLEVAHSQLRALYERLRAAEDSRSHFLANVSHELRTPLALIIGSAEQIGEEIEGSDTPHVCKLVRSIFQNAQLLHHHVDELLVLAQHDAGALRPRFGRVDVGGLLRRCLAYFEGVLAGRKIELQLEVEGDLSAEADAEMVERIILNLVFNAVKYTPREGKVRVRAEVDEANELIRIAVADSGPGIPSDQADRVFERFTVVQGTGPRPTGTGLGLPISKELAALHGGTLIVDKSDLGGAELLLALPCSHPAGVTGEATAFDGALAERVAEVAEAELSGREPEPPARGPRSLDETVDEVLPSCVLIEDGADMRRFVSVGLARDFRVRAAEDGEAGLRMIREDPPDLVVTDLMMPGVTGAEVIRSLRKDPRTADLAVLVLTAREDPGVRLELLEEGADDFVTKPFRMRELRARARNLARNKRARDLLQSEVAEVSTDLDRLAAAVAQRNKELSLAVDAARAAQDVAESANRAKTNFIRMMSHELRTPLTSLQLQIRLFERDPRFKDDKSSSLQLARLKRSANQLLLLIDGVLEFARVEAGRIELQVEPVPLIELAEEVTRVLQSHAQEKGIELCVDARGEPEPEPLPTDARLVRLVISNLVTNAVKYTREGSVTVSVLPTRSGQTIQVRDTGPGIPDGKVAEVFEPFAQLGDLRDEAGQGSGLGLSIVKELAAALGARLTIDTTPGRGSAFSLHLPKKAPTGPAGPTPLPPRG